MSNRGRAGLIVLAVAVVAVAFIALRPSDSSDKADDPAGEAARHHRHEPRRQAKDPTATAESAPPPPQEITLRDGAPQGGVKRIVVKKGDEVRLQVRTDEAGDEIHLHGYDIEKKAAAGAPANFRFKANIEGVFEIESHTAEDAGKRAADRAPGRRAVLMFVLAHGIVGRTDLPIPEWLFGWAAAVVLVISFVALAVLWPQPRLQDGGFGALPAWLSRALTSRVTDVLCGLIGVALLGLVVYSGFSGVQVPMANFASEFVFVLFWTGLVGISVLFGDVFRAFNPWRALGRFVAWISQTAAGGEMPAPLKYPERLGYIPAAVGLLAFTTLELVAAEGSTPKNVAIAALVYSAATFVGMALYGVDTVVRKGEAFSVYFNLFSRIWPWTTRDGKVGFRKPLSGLAAWEPLPGAVFLLAVMIGTVTFDGAAEAPIWTGIAPDIQDVFVSLGLSPEKGLEAAFFIGQMLAVGFVYGFYRLGHRGRAQRGRRPGRAPARQRVRALAGADRVRLRGRALPDPAALPGPVDDLPDLQPAGQGRHRLLRHRRPGGGLRRDRGHDRLVLPGGVRGGRPRGGADPGPRPRARDLRQGALGRALAVLDAGDHGRLHQPRALATGPVERMSRGHAPDRPRRPLARERRLPGAGRGLPGLARLGDLEGAGPGRRGLTGRERPDSNRRPPA